VFENLRVVEISFEKEKKKGIFFLFGTSYVMKWDEKVFGIAVELYI
jgi:hypothetical protein